MAGWDMILQACRPRAGGSAATAEIPWDLMRVDSDERRHMHCTAEADWLAGQQALWPYRGSHQKAPAGR